MQTIRLNQFAAKTESDYELDMKVKLEGILCEFLLNLQSDSPEKKPTAVLKCKSPVSKRKTKSKRLTTDYLF